MKHILYLAAFAMLGACASNETNPDAIEKDPDELKKEAVEDFIEVTELESEDRIRYSGQLSHEVITEDYVFVRDNRNTWLVAFVHTCHDIESTFIQPDIRHDTRTLRSRFDTIRGCRIRDIYPVTDGMVDEIEALIEPYEN